MSTFKIHFFKEKSRSIDIDELMQFFEERTYKVEMNDRYLKFIFLHHAIETSFSFLLTPKTTVPDIYRLNPKYLDVNFEMSVPILMSTFMMDVAFKHMETFCKHFNLAVYHPLFEDVAPFSFVMILEVYKMYQQAYLKKHKEHELAYTFIKKDVLYAMSVYTNDMKELKTYFKDVEVFVPKYQIVSCDKEVIIGFEWNQAVLTVIPPECTVCFYHMDGQVVMIEMKHLDPIIEKYFAKVPGTILGTKVLIKKYSKKVIRFMKKLPKASVCDLPKKIAFEMLMQKDV